jgi:type II secretion system protein H
MRRGFSLIEIVVVLLILGLVAAVTVPAFLSRAEPDAIARAAQDVTSVLERARRTAVERGVNTAVRLDPKSLRYDVSADSGTARQSLAQGTMAMPPGTETIAERDRLAFVFTPDGRATSDALSLRLGTSVVRILVDPWRGDVRAFRQ